MMVDVSLIDLRDLSRRSRRAHSWGALVVASAMLMVPFLVLVASWRAGLLPWASLVALSVTGLLFVRFTFLVGQSRGAYRKLFKALRPVKV